VVLFVPAYVLVVCSFETWQAIYITSINRSDNCERHSGSFCLFAVHRIFICLQFWFLCTLCHLCLCLHCFVAVRHKASVCSFFKNFILFAYCYPTYFLLDQKGPIASPRRATSPNEKGLDIGSYAEVRKKLEKERHEEYNQLLAQVSKLD
jgi:hypothetical protein